MHCKIIYRTSITTQRLADYGNADSKTINRKDIVPPLPLSFDRVNEGRSPCSTARLFQLPPEYVLLISTFLDLFWSLELLGMS